MICPYCNKETPDDAVFCQHCGKSLSQDIVCPVCKKTCAPGTRYCSVCGAELGVPQAAPKKRGMNEKTQKTLSLCGGIFMMAAVFFALIFAFFIGTTHTVTDKGYVYYETYTVWHYFGRAYSLLKSTSAGWDYSAYAMAAHYIPVVFSTVISAGTLICTVTFSLIATVKFGLHFKRPNVRYFKYATAAVFSFLLGATLFDCIHSVSTENNFASLSGITVTGMVFTCLFVVCSLILKTVAVGNGFKKKQTIIDCVCTLAGILFLSVISGFAKSEQADFTVIDRIRSTYSVNFYRINCSLSFLFDAQTPVTADYTASFVLSVCAVTAQLAILVLTFIILIRRIGNLSGERTFSLGTAIALVAVSAAYLALSAIALEFTNNVVSAESTDLIKLRLSAAPVMTFIISVFHLAVSITHKALTKKETHEQEVSQS